MKLLKFDRPKPLIEGHRAAEGLAPENSWEAIQLGYEAGADLLEIDVHRAMDGSLVIYNGYTLPNGSWIRDLNRAELSQFQNNGQALPFLDEVLTWADSLEIGLSLDLKNGFGFDRQIFLDVLNLLEKRNFLDRVILLSWDHAGLRFVKQKNSSISTRLLMRGLPINLVQILEQAEADSLNLDLDMVTPAIIDQLHSSGKFIAVGMTHYVDAPLAINSGVDIIQVRNPAEARTKIQTARRS
jgi:glycerophosphoryl diester phosphodiesterase